MDSARRPFFTADEEDEYDGDASLESMIPGFSGNGTAAQNQGHSLDHHNRFSSRPIRGSLRNIPYMGSPVSSPRSGRFHYDPRLEDQRTHFLDYCALCEKPLGNHRDIFMYRGDRAFCSEECRQEQIEMDESKEKNRNLSSLRKKDQRKSSTTSPSKSQDCPLRSGTVAAA